MSKSKIALKPYLDTIIGYCSTLSKEELTDMELLKRSLKEKTNK